jgi:FG-GAP repeat
MAAEKVELRILRRGTTMKSKRTTYRALRRRLLARASSLALRVALRPRGWVPGLLAAGLIGAPASALAQEVIDLATDAEVTIQGAAPGDSSGNSVSGAGDVNGDGIDDLLIGAGGADPNGRFRSGASYVVFGTDQGFPATIDLASDADLTIQGGEPYDLSGISVSGAGDVNGDGIDDLIIGAIGATLAGTSYVVFGAADLGGTIDLFDPERRRPVHPGRRRLRERGGRRQRRWHR